MKTIFSIILIPFILIYAFFRMIVKRLLDKREPWDAVG